MSDERTPTGSTPPTASKASLLGAKTVSSSMGLESASARPAATTSSSSVDSCGVAAATSAIDGQPTHAPAVAARSSRWRANPGLHAQVVATGGEGSHCPSRPPGQSALQCKHPRWRSWHPRRSRPRTARCRTCRSLATWSARLHTGAGSQLVALRGWQCLASPHATVEGTRTTLHFCVHVRTVEGTAGDAGRANARRQTRRWSACTLRD